MFVRLRSPLTLALMILFAGPAGAAPITDFAVYGVQEVFIGANSEITGMVGSGNMVIGDVGLNGGAGIYGDVRSGDDVNLANNCFVTGTVTNPGSFTMGSGSTVGAHITAMPDLPTLPAASVFSHGVTNQSVGNGGTITLAPGAWGDISLGGSATLNLSAGVYYLKKLTSGNGLDININLAGGTTKIYVTEAVSFGGSEVFLTGGDAQDVSVETLASGSNAFRSGGGTHWQGNVFAPNGQIHIGSGGGGSSYVGYLWAGRDVDIEHGVMGSIPEPATLALLAIAVGYGSRRR